MVEHGGRPHLLWRGGLLPWSFVGYGAPVVTALSDVVMILTPASLVGAIAAGFEPQVHQSAESRRRRPSERWFRLRS